MKRVLVVGGVAVGLVGLSFVVGLLLPPDHTVVVSRLVPGAPQEIWEVMTDIEEFPAWRPDVEQVERLPTSGFPVWRERTSGGTMTLEVTEWVPFHRWATRIADEDLGFGGTWTWELVSQGSATEVTVTERGEVYNPFYRVASLLFIDERATVTSYLDALVSRMAQEG